MVIKVFSRFIIKIVVMAIIISVMLLFLGIGILILIHICVVGRNFATNNNNSNNGNPNNGGMADRGSTSLSKEEIENLPCYNYLLNSGSHGGSSPVDHHDCAVCLDTFKKGDKCRLLPLCNHSFHAECVDSWLLKTANCPICRSSASSQRRLGDESGRIGDVVAESNSNIQLSSNHNDAALPDSIAVEIVQ